MYQIANVKVSLKTSPLFLDTVYKNLVNQNILCKQYNNFLVVKSKFTYIIFKTNKNFENHINITKIPNVCNILEAVTLLKVLTNCEVTYQQIDNIIATTKHKSQLCLKDIIEKKTFKSVKYNNEKFPGLFLKFKEGTAILFHSGKIVIVGCKSIEKLECLLLTILASI
jgi:Transcription factor TFIID (or TATA-binding protein, TBP)